jgi:hypothetical protein
MRMRKKKPCIPAILLLILITASACSTTRVRTGVVDPGLSFPAFPDPRDPAGTAIPVLRDGIVSMPQAYWTRIVEYVMDVEKLREIYEAWQAVYLKPGE